MSPAEAGGAPRLRRLTEGDLGAILALERASFPQPWTPENFLGELRRPITVPIGLAAGGGLAGQCFFWLLPPEIHLLNVAVAPAFRRRGYGRRLMRAMLAIGRRAGGHTVFLEARADNAPALGLYEGLGFRRVGLRRGYYGGGVDGVSMTLELG